MSNIVLKIHTAQQTMQATLVKGSTVKIKAQDKARYELFDPNTNQAPKSIVAKRVGNHLHISLDEQSNHDDLIIDGYYDNADTALIGMADGRYYHYIPKSGESVDYVAQLVSGDVESQLLGGQSSSNPWWEAATESRGGILPWVAGVAALGLAAGAGGGGGGGGGESAPTPTPTPAMTAPTSELDTINKAISWTPVTNAVEMSVGFTDKNNAAQMVQVVKTNGVWEVKDGAALPTGVVLDVNSGKLTLTKDAVQEKTIITATNQDPMGNKNTQPAEVVSFDLTAPAQPTNITVSQEGTSIAGSTEPNATVVIKTTGSNPTVIGTVQADSQGNFTLPVTQPLTDGTYTVTATDQAGNESAPTSVSVDRTAPAQPTIDVSAQDGSAVIVLPVQNVQVGDFVKITLIQEDGAEKIVTLTKQEEAGVWSSDQPSIIPNVTPANQGRIVIAESAIKNPSQLTAEAKDSSNNTEGAAMANVIDVKNPDAPVIEDGVGGSVVVRPVAADVKRLEIEYTNEMSGQPMTLAVVKNPATGKWAAEGRLLSGIAIDADTGMVTLSEAAVQNDKVVSAVNKDEAGNASDSTTKQLVQVQEPEVLKTENMIEIMPPSDARKMEIWYHGNQTGLDNIITEVKQDPETKQWIPVKLPDGFLLDSQTGKISVPLESIETDQRLEVIATDKEGNVSSPVAVVPDAPFAPKLIANDDGSINVKLPTDEKAVEVELTFITEGSSEEADAISFKLIKQADGTWKSSDEKWLPSTTLERPNELVILDSQVKDGSIVKGVAYSENGMPSESTESSQVTAKGTLTLTKEPVDGIAILPYQDGSAVIKVGKNHDRIVLKYYDEAHSVKGVEGVEFWHEFKAADGRVVDTVYIGEIEPSELIFVKQGDDWLIEKDGVTQQLPTGFTVVENDINIHHDSIMGNAKASVLATGSNAIGKATREVFISPDIVTNDDRKVSLQSFGELDAELQGKLRGWADRTNVGGGNIKDHYLVINDGFPDGKTHQAFVLEYAGGAKHYVMQNDVWYQADSNFQKTSGVAANLGDGDIFLSYHDTMIFKDGVFADVPANTEIKLWSVNTAKGGLWEYHGSFELPSQPLAGLQPEPSALPSAGIHDAWMNHSHSLLVGQDAVL